MTAPVTNAAASLHSHCTAPTTSSGLPKRPMGVWEMMARARSVWLPSGLRSTARFCAVTKKPGATAFTRSPSPERRASSTASQRVTLSIPAFATEYPSTPLKTRRTAIDETFTIEPEPRRLMASPNASDGMSEPCRLSRSTSSKASSGTSNTGRSSLRARATLPPAALMRMSTRPRVSSSSSLAERTLATPSVPYTVTLSMPAARRRRRTGGRGAARPSLPAACGLRQPCGGALHVLAHLVGRRQVVVGRLHHGNGFLGSRQLVERSPDPGRRRRLVDESHRHQRSGPDARREVDGVEVRSRSSHLRPLDVPVGVRRRAAVQRSQPVAAGGHVRDERGDEGVEPGEGETLLAPHARPHHHEGLAVPVSPTREVLGRAVIPQVHR